MEVLPMQVKEAIARRLSIRRYAEVSIPSEHLQTLFQAMQLAPSANNYQNWELSELGICLCQRQRIKATTHSRLR
jgi:nitroreductase